MKPAYTNIAEEQPSLALLGELELSLRASQYALLCGDVAGVERGAVEQRRLHEALETLWAKDLPATVEAGHEPVPVASLRAAQLRVLHLGRVQLALLARAQQSLRILANLLAGPAGNYGPPRPAELEDPHLCRA